MVWKRCVLGLALVALALVPPARAADARDVFTVAAVPVDATAANANAARDAARSDGERRAYAMLLDRLTLEADHNRLPPANDALLNDLISSFEVAKERTSGVRYLADYTFHFRADGVRKLLRDAGIPFAETPSKPVLVLAVMAGGAAPVLWEDPNPWRDAWAAAPPPAGLVPLVQPDGGLEDLQAIDAGQALKGDDAALQAISGRYGGADVLVAGATLDGSVAPHTLAVASTRFSPGSAMPAQSWTKSTVAAPGESDADLLAAAVAATAAQLEEAWKQANVLDFSHTGTLTARVPIDDLQGWVAVRDRLAGIPAIERSELVALDRSAAQVAIHYYGDPGQLRLALAQRDLELDGSDPDWVLERRGAAKQP